MGRWLLGILILAIVSGLLSHFGPWNAKDASKEMGQSISAALTAGGHDFATATMNGNVASLTGTAPSAVAAESAMNAAIDAKCPRCENRDRSQRWHEVRNDMNVVTTPTQSPYTFNGTKTIDGRIILNGYVKDEATKARVLADAERLFPGKVTDDKIRIALGAPNTAWPDVIRANLEEIKLLDSGEFRMADRSSFIRGTAANEDIRNRVNTMAGSMPSGYDGAANIAVPNMAAVSVGEVKDQNICQDLFNSLKGDTKINFRSAKAEVRGEESFALLNTLADAANQCASFRIQIDGHTDSQGDDAYNQSLSERRAQTVASYLINVGEVESSRINATGYGESRPVASNDNAEGMAANRRIEFTVTQAE